MAFTVLTAILAEFAAWETLHGRTPGIIRISPAAMAQVKLETLVVPVGYRGRYYLERVPGVPAEWLVDPDREGLDVMFEPADLCVV